ncbi:MAG: hypothetical protein ABEJ69_01170 [Candidatus Nanohaloarchaea archaeon]
MKNRVEMEKYPVGRLRGFIPFVRYDWTPEELHETFSELEEDLQGLATEVETEQMFFLHNDDNWKTDSIDDLLEYDTLRIGWGRLSAESEYFEGAVNYLPAVTSSNASIEADFEVEDNYETEFREVLENHGFRDYLVSRVRDY